MICVKKPSLTAVGSNDRGLCVGGGSGLGGLHGGGGSGHGGLPGGDGSGQGEKSMERRNIWEVERQDLVSSQNADTSEHFVCQLCAQCPTYRLRLGGMLTVTHFTAKENEGETVTPPCPVTPLSQAVRGGARTQTQACGTPQATTALRSGANHLQGQEVLPLLLPQFLLLQFQSASPCLWREGRS